MQEIETQVKSRRDESLTTTKFIISNYAQEIIKRINKEIIGASLIVYNVEKIIKEVAQENYDTFIK